MNVPTRDQVRDEPCHRAARLGFTLVEMMVVIGVLVLLMGILVAVYPMVTARAESSETKSTLTLLDTAMKEWELTADRRITFGPGANYDIDESLSAEQRLSLLLSILSRNTQVKEILAQVNPEFFTYDGTTYRLVDSWGERVTVIFPGVKDTLVPPADLDGTVRTADENTLGIATSQQVCFVSAGPDGKFGDLSQDQDSVEYTQTQDNVYSYEVLRP